jgi:hypothetical protein
MTSKWCEVLDWRVPLVVPALFSRNMQPALDIGRFEQLILQKNLLAIQEPDVTGIFGLAGAR